MIQSQSFQSYEACVIVDSLVIRLKLYYVILIYKRKNNFYISILFLLLLLLLLLLLVLLLLLLLLFSPLYFKFSSSFSFLCVGDLLYSHMFSKLQCIQQKSNKADSSLALIKSL